MKTESITSAQNPKIKNLLLLQEKSKARREQGLFVVEGRRELEHCLEGGFRVKTIFYCPAITGQSVTGGSNFSVAEMKADAPEKLSSSVTEDVQYIEIPEQLYKKVAYRDSTEGIIAEVQYKALSLEDLRLPGKPLVVVLESVEKPGNLGAVLRSADAAGADAVLIGDPLTDLYNPNLIRASIGAVFTVPVVAAPSAEIIPFLKARDIQILTAQLQDSSFYYDVDMRRGTAIVMGTESTGLTQVWRQAADAHIRIPMLGRLDSLNVSVSAAILLFEAVRQRQE